MHYFVQFDCNSLSSLITCFDLSSVQIGVVLNERFSSAVNHQFLAYRAFVRAARHRFQTTRMLLGL
jgi:hypothetical protein